MLCFSHYRRAAGAVIVFDVTSRESFINAKKYWYRELIDGAGEETDLLSCIMLVGNKVDLEDGSGVNCVSPAELQEAARELGLSENSVIRTSAKSGENIHRAFTSLIQRIHTQEELRKRKARGLDQDLTKNKMNLNEMKYAGDEDQSKNGCCK